MFIQIAKQDLDAFNYLDDSVKTLVPYVMIKVAHSLYGDGNSVTISVKEMWQLVTRGKRKLRTNQRENLLDWFYWYTDNKDITFDDEFKFIVKTNNGSNFIKLDMKHIVNIFTNYRFDNIDTALAITLRITSHINGDYIGLSRIEMIEQLKHKCASKEIFKVEEPNTWFLKYTMEDWTEMSRRLVAFPNVDDLLVTRYDSDKEIMDKPFIYEDNFNNHLTELEKLGVVCKVQTTYGKRRNKVVFCLVEHKDIVEQLYKRYEELATFSSEHPNEDVDEEVIEQPKEPKQITGKSSGRQRKWN